MTEGVRVEMSSVGPVALPPMPSELVILYLHGDRYLTGAPEAALGLAGRLALRTGASVVCARYRNAFPAALEDVQAGQVTAPRLERDDPVPVQAQLQQDLLGLGGELWRRAAGAGR